MANTTAPEPTRRDFIYIATGAVAAVGAALAAWPFIDQMNPIVGGARAGLDRSRHLADPGRPAGRLQLSRPSAVRAPPHPEGDRRGQGRAAVRAARSARAQRQPARRCAGDRCRTARSSPNGWSLVGVCTHLGCTPTVHAAVPKAITAAGSATATARNTIPPAASAKGLRRRTWPMPTYAFLSPHARSKSAKERIHVRSLDLRSENRLHPLARFASAAHAFRARHDADLPDAAEPELLVRVRRHPDLLLGIQIVTGIVLAMHYVAELPIWPSTASKTSCAT